MKLQPMPPASPAAVPSPLEILNNEKTEADLPGNRPDQEEQITTPQGIRLHYSEWRPSQWTQRASVSTGECATILLVHGYGEHLGRYGRLARQLTAHGFRVGGCDHQGMGRSGGTQMYIQDYEHYVQDVMVAQARLRQSVVTTRTPAFVFGHSMGGLVALRHAQTFADQPFAGTVLSGPLLGVGLPVPAWQILLGKLLARVAPGFHFPFQIRPELLTQDMEVQQAIITDPLMPRFTTPAWYMATNRAMTLARQEIEKVRWPTLWQIGSADQVCSPAASQEVFSRLKASPGLSDMSDRCQSEESNDDSTLLHEWREYPGLRHEVHNELPAERDRAFADLLVWLNTRLREVR